MKLLTASPMRHRLVPPSLAALLTATLCLLAGLFPYSASALPGTGPVPTGQGTVTIDDSNAYPGGQIVIRGEGLELGNYSTGLSIKILWTPASEHSSDSWVQLNWTNPDGQFQAGVNGYTAVEQPQGTNSNDVIVITDPQLLPGANNGTFEYTLQLPEELQPDLYYSQVLSSDPMLARGDMWQVTNGPTSLTSSLDTAQSGDTVTLTARNFAPFNTWDVSTFKAADPIPVTFTLGDTVLGTALPDANGQAVLTTTVPSGLGGEQTFTATQRHRTATDTIQVLSDSNGQTLAAEASIQAESAYWGDQVDFIASRVSAADGAVDFDLQNAQDQQTYHLGQVNVGSDNRAVLTVAIPENIPTGYYYLVARQGQLTIRSTSALNIGGAAPEQLPVVVQETYCLDGDTLVANPSSTSSSGNLANTGTSHGYGPYVFVAVLALALGITLSAYRRGRASAAPATARCEEEVGI